MNMSHKFKTVLYHGSVSEIKSVDVSIGKGFKDFGKGFYMAVSKQQAIGMMHKKYRETKRKKNGFPIKEYLYEIELDPDVLQTLNVRYFTNADIEWLDFVIMCRKSGGVPHDYDMIVGPTADDDTSLCLKYFSQGAYGPQDSFQARDFLLRMLEPDKLGVQYFIGKQDVADRLIKKVQAIEWR